MQDEGEQNETMKLIFLVPIDYPTARKRKADQLVDSQNIGEENTLYYQKTNNLV